MAEAQPSSNPAKRKWFQVYGDAPTPPRIAKRTAATRQPSKEDLRREIAGVYTAYDALFKSCQEGRGQEGHYLALLKAAEGSPAAKRLVARLLPRFVRHFPQQARATGDVLTELSRLSLSEASAAAADTRRDALAGLPAVIAAAKAETDHQPVIKLVNYAFKQLQSLPAASVPTLPPGLGLANGTSPGSQPPAAAATPLFTKSTEPLWAILEAAFAHFPRVVLAACIHALKKPSDNPQLFAVATQFVGSRLLAPRSAAQQRDGADSPAATAGSGPGAEPGVASDGKAQQQDGDTAEGGPQQQQQHSSRPSLFKEVMGVEEREQRWFRQHVQQFLQELPPSTGADACVVLQQLVKELPPSPQRTPRLPSAPTPGKQPRRDRSEERASTKDGRAADSATASRRLAFSNGPQQAEHQQQQQHGSPAKRVAFGGSGSARPDSRLQPPQSALPPHLQATPATPAPGAPAPKAGPAPLSHLPLHPPGFGGPAQGGARPLHAPPPPMPAQRLPASPAVGASRFGRSFDEGPASTSYTVEGEARGDKRGPGALGGSADRLAPAGEPGRLSHPVPMDADGASARTGASQGAPGPLPPFPSPGDNVCLAAACLWLCGLPAYLDETDVARECGRHGRVAGAVLPPPVTGQPGVAYVNFPSVRDAMRCYEAMCEAAPWRGCRPLDMRFCSSEAYAPTALQPPGPKPCTHAWVSGVANIQDEGEVMRCCKDAGVPAPEHLLRVGGRHPGLLMSFAHEGAAASAVQAIRDANLRLSGFPTGHPGCVAESGVGLAGPAGPSGILPPAEANGLVLGGEARGPGAPRGPPQVEGASLLPLPPGGTPGVALPPEANLRLPPPEYMSKTLWVGQIPPTMRDEEVLCTFNQCGEVVGHKFMRHTNCAFVDFATQAGATEARKKLDGARVGAAQFRVEYKNEKQWWAGQGARAAAAAGAGPGARDAAPPSRADTGPLQDRDSHHPAFRDQPREDPPRGVPPSSSSSNPRAASWGPPVQGGPPPLQPNPPLGGHLQPPQHQPPPLLQQPGKHPPQGGAEGPGRPGPWGAAGPEGAVGQLPPPPFSRGGPPPTRAPLQGAPALGPPPGWPRGPPPPPLHLGQPPREGAPGPPGGPQEAHRDAHIRRLESVMSLGPLPSASLPPPPGFAGAASVGQPLGGLPPPTSSALPVGGLQPPQPRPAGGQPPQQQQQQAPAWHGKLAKSKVPVCGVACIDPPGAAGGPAGLWAAQEPQNWPPVLDVGMRADLQYVCGTMYSQVPPGERAVRRVVPLADPAHQRAFSDFVRYLAGKSRAGVVKLPALQPVGTRVMYLIPPSESACAALGVPQETSECMLALIVPGAVK